MEMCKVDSSTDSETDASPRWSDASSKGFASSATVRRTALRLPVSYKPSGWHHLQLDPYDGSSEDSEASADCFRRPKLAISRLRGRIRRGPINPVPFLREALITVPKEETNDHHPEDIHMSSDCEIQATCQEVLSPCMDVSGPEDSGVLIKSASTSPTFVGQPVICSQSNQGKQDIPAPHHKSKSPSFQSAQPKKRLFLPPGEMGGCCQRKRLRVANKKDETSS
ncbi:uncharacterized protein LOC114784634 [Denticeps clupeoides]|uniref:uncharacterized protein LOC114784634 n=1 Tax=Denticeps clupeoides TaxID=299321 RepID=UPI0010A53C0D|nr:uncharacterized protein LOC114784634 [Denticeps clupeoides]